ncbi:aldo/keto reductase [Cellulomonas soli]|uniref:aldo/keto reductase n=1 Tax=Cellulomonas soli TaxID=931535 RepID=UPI003F85E765
MPLIELAMAFAIRHPGVTSPIVGPRTMEQFESYLPAVDRVLSDDVLDRIDEIVAPGVAINRDDESYGAAELAASARRR